MSAMPEREVFATELNEQEWLVSYLREAMKMAEKLVPESRLLAAEARVRELEVLVRNTEVDTNGAPVTELNTLRAERDALVELVRDVARSGVAFEDKRLDYVEIQIDTDTWAQARAILAREET